MAKRIKVQGILRKEPDVRLVVLALMELARQQQGERTAAGETPEAEYDDLPDTDEPTAETLP